MAHFIGYVKGNRGEASRLGSKDSGIYATVRGWEVGGSVELFHDKERNIDTVHLDIDKGSNGRDAVRILGAVNNDGEIELTYVSQWLRDAIAKLESKLNK